jgi:hypothetical protein
MNRIVLQQGVIELEKYISVIELAERWNVSPRRMGSDAFLLIFKKMI